VILDICTASVRGRLAGWHRQIFRIFWIKESL